MLEVLLVGNPNSGKTTLFNSLTSSNEHIGNWHGVTVENKKKSFVFENEEFMLVDTPGIYSLCPLSFEEKISVQTILQNKGKVINLCDGNNIRRNLYLTLCLLEKNCDCVVAINQIVKKSNCELDFDKLSKLLGVDIVNIDAEKKNNLEQLKKLLLNKKKTPNLPYLKKLKYYGKVEDFILIKLYEKDEEYLKQCDVDVSKFNIPQNSIEILAELRFDYINNLLSICEYKSIKVYGKSKIDKIILNKWLAFPMFLVILSCIFYFTFFSIGAFFSDLLGNFLNVLTTPILNLIENSFGQNFVYDFFASAVFGGLGTVVSFLPQVVLLFFFLSLLEDSGYMARIAFIFEDILGKIGLSGKSIYTLLMGFGCSTTAIMTSRNMEDKNAKIKTALLCPYMSCSAKIPIYTVIGGAFFGINNIFLIIGLYLLGIVVAILISKILDVTVLKSKNQSFILEFPPYRMTSFKRIKNILWKNVKEFLIRIGSVMISMNIIIWVLSSFNFSFNYVSSNGGSMLESIGKFLAPIFSPLGFGNWAIVSSLLAGLVAKEVVVSSIAMFNGIESSATKLLAQSILIPTSLVFFASKASVIAFLVFCLLYTPCIASISMLLQEVGKKWTIFSIIIQLLTAYIVSFIIYNISFAFEIFGFIIPFFILFLICLCVFSFIFIFTKIKKRRLCSKCSECLQNCQYKK